MRSAKLLSTSSAVSAGRATVSVCNSHSGQLSSESVIEDLEESRERCGLQRMILNVCTHSLKQRTALLPQNRMRVYWLTVISYWCLTSLNIAKMISDIVTD